MKTEIEKNIEYVNKNRETLFAQYPNKHILVVDCKVIKAFNSYNEAVVYGVENYGIKGNFLIHFMTQQESTNFLLQAAF